MPNVDTLMAGVTPKFIATFGKTVNARYYPDSDPNNYVEFKVILQPLQDQRLDEGAVDLQYVGQAMLLSTRNNTEGRTSIVCHGDAANVGGGDRVKFDDDSYATFWNVQEILMNRAGMAEVRIVNNPGAIE